MKSNAASAIVNVATRVTRWVSIASTVFIAAMLLINVIAVVGSKWFHWSLPGHLELTEQLMAFVSILPVAFIALERGHIRITMVIDRFAPPVNFAIEVLGHVLGILVMGFITWRVFVQMQYTMNTNITTLTLSYPVWITNLAIMIGFGLLALSFLLLLVKLIAIGPKK
jgi:TRAP-type C4-dicarboxylate transport system permease small subunit